MAPKHRFETDVYAELFEVAKLAREAADPMGGKLMSHDVWMHYVKDIVVGDLTLDRLEKETARLRREVTALDVSATANLSELLQVEAKYRQLEWDSLFNGINIRRALQHAESLKGDMTARYLS